MSERIVCPACSIEKETIKGVDVFHPRVGGPFTPAQTYARACKYAKTKGCINSVDTISTSEERKHGYTPPKLTIDYEAMANDIEADLNG